MNNKLKEKIASMPDAPGVYLMKDTQDKVIYIGKAKSLKKRLNSYLRQDLSTKTVALMEKVCDIEYRSTATEAMALLLEANLVHQYKPRYNVSLRDDKSFPFVKITREKFPGLYITRKKDPDAARYLGPYTNVKLLRQALKVIRRHFPYRSCRKMPKEPCLYGRINLCPLCCVGKISAEEYAKRLKDISLILEGKADSLIKKLTRGLQMAARELKFEEAAKIRDQISALSAMERARACASPYLELEELKELLKLKSLPERIEAFDISNISGRQACGSMVAFCSGLSDKDNYRRFRIKSVHSIDDYAMLAEVVRRRYAKLIALKLPLPDLILIDGGRGHLLTAQKELKALNLKIPLASIAKREENIYIEAQDTPIKLKSDTPALNLLRRIRDEAHRFAISYHHILRRKEVIGK